ncbi:TPA: helix-turn-helix domain-containing protein [Escherichia coli]|nr:helix-turn-helix domain-containing protein [Enterobacter hormaechei]EJN9906976.1 helix-turn-helix domain-containing protein [Escherichia coli]ELY6322470.1 helix-turn-helix domain-containing protein [Cronobacter turicensis]MDQ5103020.1 helix-turn-helix domain-containing protein [Klebsiella pneumoniae]QMF95585.1 helix-turn-helix domain-containing protein [Citrobacter freundii]ELH1425917.1 helix-turn-helix domain-containing protein [Enterobacter hormaechei]
MIPRWAPMYSWWIQDEVIQRLNWRNNELGRPAAKTAALMLYIAITMKSSEEPGMSPVKITYNRLSEMTGISRELIREGITILESLEMISVEKVGRNNIYKLINKRMKGGWCKIPVKPLMTEDGKVISPFKELRLRRKIELHAIKIFLYLASVRDNHTEFSVASYETIRKAIGASDKDISRALTLLSIIGLLARVSSEKAEDNKVNQPNRYYLIGYKSFARSSEINL